MALVVKDRVKETTTTTGTGTLTLDGAATGFQAFSVIGDGNTTYYAITNGTDWEVGIGTYTSSGTTLSRDTILESSNSGSAVDWLAGSKDVFVTYPAEKAIYFNAADQLDVDNLRLDGNTLSSTNTDGNVVLDPNGTGAVDVSSAKIINVAAPTSGGDATNKTYVDSIVAAGVHFHEPVRVESPINLTATYDNGTDGVGATLTNSGTQAALVIDGVTVNVSDRVLIYEQTTQTQNGVYTVTDTGSVSTNWVLTRATDADTYEVASPAGLSEGSTFFVQEGTTGAGETYTCNTVGTITFGTTNITFAQISSAQIYSAGAGLDLTGTQFSVETNGITNAMLRQSAGLSVIGRSANSTGDVADITAASDNEVLRRSGTSIGFGTVATGGIADDAVTNDKLRESAALSVIGNATNATANPADIAAASDHQVLRRSGTAVAFGAVALNQANAVTGALPFDNGGTGQATQQAAMNALAGAITSGQYLRGNGTNVVMSSIQAGDVPTLNQNTTGSAATLTTARDIQTNLASTAAASFNGSANITPGVTGTLPVGNGGTGQTSYVNGQLLIGNTTGNTLTKATLTAGTGISVTNGTGSITIAATNNGTVTSVSGTGTVQGLTLSGTVTSSGNLTLGGSLSAVNLASQVTGTLPVANGGTGAATLTANNVILGNGTSAVQFVAPGTSGNVLTSNGTTWTSAAGGGGGGGDYIKRTYTSPTTWTKPAGLKAVKVTVVGGGGGSGAGGTASTLRLGANGGTSSFGPFASATGGVGGAGPTPGPSLIGSGISGGGGSGSGGDINMRGFSGQTDGGGSTRFQPGFQVNGRWGGSSSMGFAGYSTGMTSPPANPETKNVSPAVAGSAGSGGSSRKAGGGGGGTAIKYLPEASIPGPVSVTVGGGGGAATGAPVPVEGPATQAGNTGIVIVEEFY